MSISPTLLQDTFSLRLSGVYTNAEYRTDRLPLIYGDLKYGSGGISYCPCIDTGNFRYLISDAPIVASPNARIYVDGAEVVTGFQVSSEGVDETGRNTAQVRFDASQLGKRVGYRGKGIRDSGGNLVQNPIGVARDLVVNRLGIAEADMDATSYARAYERASAQGYIAAGILQDQRSMAYTLTELLGPFLAAVVITNDRRLGFRIDIGSAPDFDEVAFWFRPERMRDVTLMWDRANILNQVVIDHSPNYYSLDLEQFFQMYDPGEGEKDLASQQVHGRLGPGVSGPALEARWIRDAATIDAIQAVLVGKWKNPRFTARFTETSWRASHLEIGDICGFSWPFVYDQDQQPLTNQYVSVVGISPDPRSRTVSVTVVDTGFYPLDAGARDRRDYSS